MEFKRNCVGCGQPFTLTRRAGFLCPACIKEIREEAERIKAEPLHRWQLVAGRKKDLQG